MRIFIALFFFTATIAAAEPSYDCSGRLNDVEKQICDDPQLGDLDRAMARQYRALMRNLSPREQLQLRAEQLGWQVWRNSCPRRPGCLRLRYEERIRAFAEVWAGAAPQPAAGCPSGEACVVERRFKNGRFEVVYSDGRIEWTNANGGSSGVIYPDGQETVMMKSQVVGASFPGLPGEYESWGNALEGQLQYMVESLLPESDRAGYRAMMAGKLYSERVLDHADALNFLIQQ